MKIRRFNLDQEELGAFFQSAQNDLKIDDEVSAIGREVKTRGNQAIFELTRKFDGAVLTEEYFRVSAEEIDQAYDWVDDEYLGALWGAIDNIRAFHVRQRKNSWMEPDDQDYRGQILRPVERAGIYVPGGTAAYLVCADERHSCPGCRSRRNCHGQSSQS